MPQCFVKNQEKFEKLWKKIEIVLEPLGNLPDKANLDWHEILMLYSELMKSENIRDKAQVAILRRECALATLNKLVN